MNFKEQYKAAFSEIHASEDTIERICEVTTMKDINANKTGKSKSKKIFISMLAAAAFVTSSAVAVSAGALNGTFDNIRMYINGEEVSASDYVNGKVLYLGDDNEAIVEISGLPDDSVGATVSVKEENDVIITYTIDKCIKDGFDIYFNTEKNNESTINEQK